MANVQFITSQFRESKETENKSWIHYSLMVSKINVLLSTKRNSFTCKHRQPMSSSRKSKSYILDSEVILLEAK